MRGNAVMRAKRVTGPSAQTILRTHIACEKCSVKDCKAEGFKVTRNIDRNTYRRVCLDHLDRL